MIQVSRQSKLKAKLAQKIDHKSSLPNIDLAFII